MVERALYTPVDRSKRGVDITRAIRSCIQNGVLHITATPFPDPDPEQPKVLVIDGVWGGVGFTMRIDDPAITRFSFGPLMENPK
jgi:hypothetical protein